MTNTFVPSTTKILSRDDIFHKIQTAVAETTGVELEEVTPTTDLSEFDQTDILRAINYLNGDPELRINLSIKNSHLQADLSECETFDDLLDLVEDAYRYDRLEDDF
jgi:hypothetical protein